MISVKAYPESGAYRLYSNQTNSCQFFDAHDDFEAKKYACGQVGMMQHDKHGTLTHLPTGRSWAIAIEITMVLSWPTVPGETDQEQARRTR